MSTAQIEMSLNSSAEDPCHPSRGDAGVLKSFGPSCATVFFYRSGSLHTLAFLPLLPFLLASLAIEFTVQALVPPPQVTTHQALL